MATTRFISMHIGKGKTIAASLKLRTDYAKNPDKTQGGELISSYECDPRTVDLEFLLAKKEYTYKTGRDQGKRDVLAYQIRQSFKPGEVSPEDANRVGYELAMRFTKGNHAFFVATHVDKKHIHNHVIFNSTTLDCERKFVNFFRSGRAIRKLSDQICLENGLSVVENPKPSRGHYGTWLGEKPASGREKIRIAIDSVLETKPTDFEVFLREMEARGYEVKRGKNISFRAPEQKRPARCRSLGEDYSESAIRERIAGTRIVAPRVKPLPEVKPFKLNLLIQIEDCIKAKNSPGYERWAKVFNLKQAAQTLAFLEEQGLDEYEKLSERATSSAEKFHAVSDQIKLKEARLHDISALQKQIGSYAKTREIYAGYRKSGYSKKYQAEHESEILLHQAAKKYFDEIGLKKLPSVKGLRQEYAGLLAEKKKLYASYRTAREYMQKLQTAKMNADTLLGVTTLRNPRETRRTTK